MHSELAATALDSEASSIPSLIAGRYRIEEELARGGMGVVYRASDRSGGPDVAIKRLLPERAAKASVLELFQREYRTLSGLKHPRIIAVHDYGIDDTGPYYTMELLSGRDLRSIAPLPYREAARHLRDVASSLALLHAHRLVHRDVSATNVRLTQEGRAKLLDFGALVPFGNAEVVVGTPSSTSPEALAGKSLDQRADLYSLGCLAYWLLTGRHAYPAKSFDMLRSMWQTAPVPVSSLVSGLPEALVDLVMSLLSLDPLARPESAAEVIDRLNTVADLDPEDDGAGPRSYLLSSVLVGRDQEVRQLMRRVSRLEDGRGSAVSIEGPVGMGKTRLLAELTVGSRLRGFPVLEISAREHQRPYGVASAVAVAAVRTFAGEAKYTLVPHLPVLGHAFPEIMQEGATLIPLDEDPVERRLRTLAAFAQWMIDLSERRPFVIAIDDADHIDAASTALLAALTHNASQHQILLVTTLRTGHRGASESGMAVLRAHAEVIRLQELRSEDTAQLSQTLFGQAPNTGRLASWLHDLSSGNPMQCMELVAHLVGTRVIRYAQGTWVLPHELAPSELPAGVEQARAERIAQLSPEARSLADMLSLHRGALSPQLCHALSEVAQLRAPLALLNELSAKGILVRGLHGYLFTQEPMREALAAGLEPERLKLLHRTIGQVLLRETDLTPEVEIEAGFHLIRAGDVEPGAVLLESGAEKLATVGEGLRDAIPAFEAVLRIYRAQGRTWNQCLHILRSLIVAGQATDRALVERYGDLTFRVILDMTGLKLAAQLRPFMGRRLAVYVGLFVAATRFALTPKRFRFGTVTDLFVHSFGVAVLLVASYLSLMEPRRIASILQGMAPLAWLPKGDIGHFLHDMCTAFHAMALGRDREASRLLEELKQRLDDPTQLRNVAHPIKQRLRGGVILARGVCEIHLTTPQGVPQLAELEALDLSFYNMGAAQLRMLYHAHRGEMTLAQTYREQVELLAVQGGSTWQMEIFLPSTLAVLYDLTRDLIGLKRAVEQLDRVSRHVPALQQHRDLQRAAYLARQGRGPEALALFETVFASLRAEDFSSFSSATAQYAESLNDAGQHARARELCLAAEAHATLGDNSRHCSYDLVRRQLALAEAGLGNVERAAELLEQLITQLTPSENPLQLGLAHRDRALVALQTRERAVFEYHFRNMEKWFRATAYPALVAQCDRVRAKGVGAGFLQIESSEEAAQLLAILEGHEVGEERINAVLELVTRMAGAKSGYFYGVEGRELRMRSAFGSGEEPPTMVAERIHGLSSSLLRDEHTTNSTHTQTATGTTSTSTASETGDELGPSCGVFVLHVPVKDRLRVVGALALVRGQTPLVAPSYKALNTIARSLSTPKKRS